MRYLLLAVLGLAALEALGDLVRGWWGTRPWHPRSPRGRRRPP